MRNVRAWRLENLDLTGADCFVLDMLAANLPHNVMDQVGDTVFLLLLHICYSSPFPRLP